MLRRVTTKILNPYVRGIILRPEETHDHHRYPLGYVPLDGSEHIDGVYALLKSGYFVAPLNSIETIHRVYTGAHSLCKAEFPIISSQDIVAFALRSHEIESKILIRRDFWLLDDYNNEDLNKSFGIQNLYFDNYKWSQVLWKRFQVFVEEYFPLTDHTHLLYSQYIELIKSFSVFEQGTHVTPLLPKKVTLHPPYGIPVPSKATMEPLLLLKQWVTNFRSPLMLNRALVVNTNSGAAAFSLKLCGVSMVRATDSSPRAIASCQADAMRDQRFSGISFQVSEMLRCSSEASRASALPKKYDLIVYYPDENIMSMVANGETAGFAPGLSGFVGNIEQFFEHAGPFLSDTGVVAICCTNIHSILRPAEAHPVEYEVKVNRRFVILDYYDTPLRYSAGSGALKLVLKGGSPLRSKMRSELWILHKLESIHHFAFMHGIPGAQPPSTSQRWKNKRLSILRQRSIRDHVERMGDNWGHYKSRLLSMLQEQCDTAEDDVAEAVRMTLDPSYPVELAERARIASESEEKLRDAFDLEVRSTYSQTSPREAFDSKEY